MLTTPRLSALALALLSAAAAAGAPAAPVPEGDLIGLYPIALPQGQEALQARLAAQLHDGAASLPRVRAFDLIPRGACMPDEGGCLAAAARSAGLGQIVSAQVRQQEKGYAFVLRLFAAADGAQRSEQSGEVAGGPLDLAGALEHGVCGLLGAAPCLGAVVVRVESDGCKAAGAAPKLVLDGVEQGALPLPKPLSLPVGRHALRAGSGEERKVRVSYARETRLRCQVRAGAPELVDDLPDAAPPPLVLASVAAPAAAVSARPLPALSRGQRWGRGLIAGGAALLAASAGLGLFAQVRGAALDSRYRAGALTDADKPVYGEVHAAGVAALATAVAGGAALAAGAVVLVASPSGAAVQGRF